MSDVVQHAPRFSLKEAEQIARERFNIRAFAEKLPSERDQNFLLAAEDGSRYVLKIANARETYQVLDFQNKAMSHILKRKAMFTREPDPCPRVLSDVEGETIGRVVDAGGRRHYLRLLSYLEGKPLALARPHDGSLFDDMGRFFAELDLALEDFEHPGVHREFHWDLQHCAPLVAGLLPKIADREKRSLVEAFLRRYTDRVLPRVSELRKNVIHSDGNDYNLLVETAGLSGNRVSGIIDFGDMVYSQRINELAIVLAYALLDKRDPLTAAGPLVAGYYRNNPLTETELSLLFELICMRLCLSVCHAAGQSSLEPDNDYLLISEQPAWELLAKMAAIAPGLPEYVFRSHCGLPAPPNFQRVNDWIRGRKGHFAPVVDPDLTSGKCPVLDLSVSSPSFEPGPKAFDLSSLSKMIDDLLESAEEKACIGRADEVRLFYTDKRFALDTDEMPENRTVHLGIDVFMPAGSRVYAPLEGKVVSAVDNAGHLDYGPTIILEHATDQGDVFYTLFGHLSRESLTGLKKGRAVDKGERIAWMGEQEVNGGWPPHLHFQVMHDLLGLVGDFPGVARPSQREVWSAIVPDPSPVLGLPRPATPEPERSPAQLAARRRQILGRNLSLAYARPLKIVRGIEQYLFDEQGRRFLDGVNNVCHVGHCHPKVVEAGRKQMGILNTNTRYLHETILEYAQNLLHLFPDPLSVCFFVCSGSEANELALRLARTFTGRDELIIVDGAYHGNTQGLIDISPYKHDGPGGRGRPDRVQKTLIPDGYRGRYKGFEAETGRAYAGSVSRAVEAIKDRGRLPAAFMVESMLGCGGQIVLPEGYLRAAFEPVRAAGGVCIVDEVQVGFGRVGSHFWAFETQEVVPDIVTLGKPMGNGHPLAAVVTTPAIAESFANGMEYFNTFGGNPVSCAVGQAVLDVVFEEGLQERAGETGAYLMSGLQGLAEEHSIIGHVRGLGLFLGVELVKDRQTLEPAALEADYIVNRLREHGILISTDGPLDNVLKMKPPLVFERDDADYLLGCLDKVLREDALKT
ncbi:MAG: aminotransferase class III-fold pyridoxal phosphate-dependent enzyme [Desulfohalobiaceae bacterium]|nr:aminotransferase class III-fold pyridoxal phosphate-dependent enzyme [Desulfohalobiaceae bacterium]